MIDLTTLVTTTAKVVTSIEVKPIPPLEPLIPLAPVLIPQPKVETLVPAEVSKIQNQLDNLQAALETTPMGDVKGHMLVLQHELQSTEYLVDMLQPTDIGLLVKAQRVMMEEDILLNSAPKTRAKKRPTAASTKAAMANISADAFALPLGLT